ncbi:MAG: hypothetical protein HKM03_03460 [Steroidobacteraceae bacterium]|nr:hypothetical protein [Steroidobacteraceae bacterium]
MRYLCMAAALAALLSGCGQRGPLILPGTHLPRPARIPSAAPSNPRHP